MSSLFSADEMPEIPGGDAPWPVPMIPSDEIGMKEAEDFSGRDQKTIKRWCREFGIGGHAGANSPWVISGPGLMLVKRGWIVELELLRQGRRSHPRVRRAIADCGFVP